MRVYSFNNVTNKETINLTNKVTTMKHKPVTFTELLAEYKVRCIYDVIDSNIVYPWDNNSGFTTIGRLTNDEVDSFLIKVHSAISIETMVSKVRISNKFCIPMFITYSLHKQTTFFCYEHDGNQWLLSKTEDSKMYV